MDAAQAISLVANWIRSRGLDYPTEGLEADRFEAGWGGGGAEREEARAISLGGTWIRSGAWDSPTEGREGDLFEGGGAVYEPVDVDESDPMAFLDMPVGQSVFLVGDSGRIKEVSSSVPP